MANITTIARPYAKAIIALAGTDAAFGKWSEMLLYLSNIVQDVWGRKILSDLAIPGAVKADFICDLYPGALTTQGQNLVKLLARSKRLLILPELYKVYEKMRMEIQQEIHVKLTVASAVDKQELNIIRELCAKSIKGNITLIENVENDLIGGGIAQIGNRVINASITGRLQAMRNLLNK